MICMNKTRTSKVGAISKAQKAQNIISEKTNIHSLAKYQISKKLKGDPLEEIFFRSLTMPKNWKGGPFEVFQHPFCRKTWKNWRKKLFSGKNLTMPKKTERGDPLGFFNIHSVAKHQKKCRGDPLGKNFFFRKKSLVVPKKNWKGGPFGVARYGMLRGKTGKTSLVQFARPNGAIWHHNIW